MQQKRQVRYQVSLLPLLAQDVLLVCGPQARLQSRADPSVEESSRPSWFAGSNAVDRGTTEQRLGFWAVLIIASFLRSMK